jgi:hypothetical protein
MTVETHNSTTTWVCPTGVTSVNVECEGAGGGGGRSSTTSRGGGGGGGAYAATPSVVVVPGNSYAITIGAGGTAGVTGSQNGGVGGDTSFGASVVLAKGGAGGNQGGAGAGVDGAGGAAASCVGTTKTSGTAGNTGNGGAGAAPLGGAGGTLGNPGTPGTAPGGGAGGGAGGTPVRSGGLGADGRIVLTYTIAAPGVPTGLVSTPLSDASIRLEWSAPTGNVTGYDVRVNGGAATDIGNVLTHDFTGLAPGTTYMLEVRAHNADSSSAYASDSETTMSDPPPDVPTGLATTPDVTAIELTWAASTGSPTGYDVRIDGGAPTDVGNVLSHDFTGLTASIEYLLEVRAYNANGDSGWASISETTLADTPPPSSNPSEYEPLTYHMNRKAGTLVNGVPTLDATGAANEWAGTSGLALVGALNVVAGNTLPNYKDILGVLNQLAGTTGLGMDGAANQIP